MGYCIEPKWVNEKLKELNSKGLKVGKLTKFKGYHYFVQSSILQIAENIGNIVGFDSVTIEPNVSSGDADIRFIDDAVYYLQVKSPLFFKQKYGSKFTDISKEFDRILSKSRSRFAVGYATGSSSATGSSLIPIHVEDIHKPGRRASLGILVYDTSFVLTSDIVRKVEDMSYDANKQLGKIQEKSWKIFILDITHYPARGNLDFYYLLANIFWPNPNVFKAIDGIGLFSWNPAQRSDYTLPSTIIPILLKKGITSRVFKQPFQLYQGMMITMPTSMYMYKGWNDLLEINKEGYIGVDGVEYGPFWEYVKLLYRLNFRYSRNNKRSLIETLFGKRK
ncbi:MAG: hypothetical protein N2V75_08930 [Methanophagales archaeon]|nr:hypothetical protein [Methanophagales archaeon]